MANQNIFGLLVLLPVLAVYQTRATQMPLIATGPPHLVSLNRETYPIYNHGKVVSHKASYSGLIHVGDPHSQEFRVVFDTGSGHVVLPSSNCKAIACQNHRRYNVSDSVSGFAVNLDGSLVPPGNLSDQVTIGFGTGKVTGEFFRDRVCLGPQGSDEAAGKLGRRGPCADVHGVMAVDMSRQPFEMFAFDGILGLGLAPLAIASNFSFFDVLAHNGEVRTPHFGVFLSGDGSPGEIAIGGHNPQRLNGPLSWVAAARPELGHWQVQILALHVGGRTLDFCSDGSCHGILDTGTTHIGIPKDHEPLVSDLLTLPAGDSSDCRALNGLPLVIELRGLNLTVHSKHYLRPLPLADGDLTTGVGVSPTSYLGDPAATNGASTDTGAVVELDRSSAKTCRPKIIPVNMPSPLGPNLFILGEPLLQSHYTVFDWGTPQIGFGVAANHLVEEMGNFGEQALATVSTAGRFV